MRQHFATAARLFFPAYANAIVWVLAGCGWGVVIGAGLEAAFGRGADGLLDAAGETALLAVAGALAGMVGISLILACGHIATLVPGFYLIGKAGGLYKAGTEHLGVMHERSPRVGLATSLVLAVMNGTWMGPLGGAGSLLESMEGRPVPSTMIQWCTLLGLLAGGIVGVVAMGREFYRKMPESWRAAVRLGMRPVPR
jgi:hypothetical protein